MPKFCKTIFWVGFGTSHLQNFSGAQSAPEFVHVLSLINFQLFGTHVLCHMLTQIIWAQEGMFSVVFDGVEHDVQTRFVSFCHFGHFLETTFFKF